jgi:hypothetical protein
VGSFCHAAFARLLRIDRDAGQHALDRYHFPEKKRGLAPGSTPRVKIPVGVAVPVTVALSGFLRWRGMFVVLRTGLRGVVDPWQCCRERLEAPGRRTANRATISGHFLRGLMHPRFGNHYRGVLLRLHLFYVTWLPAYFVEQRHLSVKSGPVFGGQLRRMAIVAAPRGMVSRQDDRGRRAAVTVRRLFTIVRMLLASSE